MVARASEFKPILHKPLSLLLFDSSVANEYVQIMQSTFESDGHEVSLCSLSDLPSTSTDIVSLLEINDSGPFFKDLSETRFKGLIHLVEQCYRGGNRILWVTGPAQISTQNPYHAMVLGLARTLRLELGSIFATLELDTIVPGPSQCDAIVQVFRKLQARASLSYGSMDCEFAFANGNICIPRFITSDIDGLLRKNMDSMPTAKRLFIKNPGLLSSLQWGLQSRASALLDGEVEVHVRTASLNSWVTPFLCKSLFQLSLTDILGLCRRQGHCPEQQESGLGVCGSDMSHRCQRETQFPAWRSCAVLVSWLSLNLCPA